MGGQAGRRVVRTLSPLAAAEGRLATGGGRAELQAQGWGGAPGRGTRDCTFAVGRRRKEERISVLRRMAGRVDALPARDDEGEGGRKGEKGR